MQHINMLRVHNRQWIIKKLHSKPRIDWQHGKHYNERNRLCEASDPEAQRLTVQNLESLIGPVLAMHRLHVQNLIGNFAVHRLLATHHPLAKHRSLAVHHPL